MALAVCSCSGRCGPHASAASVTLAFARIDRARRHVKRLAAMRRGAERELFAGQVKRSTPPPSTNGSAWNILIDERTKL